MRFLENVPFVLLRDLSLEHIECPSNKTAVDKAPLKEILFEDELGTSIFEESDGLLITKHLFPSKGSNTIKFLSKFQCIWGNIDICLFWVFFSHE